MMISISLVMFIGIVLPVYLIVSIFKKKIGIRKLVIGYSIILIIVAGINQYSVFEDKLVLANEDKGRLDHLSEEEIQKLPEGCKPRSVTDYEISEIIIGVISFCVPIFMLAITCGSKSCNEYLSLANAQQANAPDAKSWGV